MTLNQLGYFYQAAVLQHFNQAAEKMNISEPSLSRSISSLEDELGVLIFERSKSAVRGPPDKAGCWCLGIFHHTTKPAPEPASSRVSQKARKNFQNRLRLSRRRRANKARTAAYSRISW